LPTPNHLIGDRGSVALVTNTTHEDRTAAASEDVVPVSAENKDARRGCSIISRFPNSTNPGQSVGYDLVKQRRRLSESGNNQIRDFKGCSGRLDDSTYIRPSTAVPSVSNSAGRHPDDKVQCNEVSSSEDSPSHRSGPSQRSSAGHSQRSAPSTSSVASPVNPAAATPLAELKSEPSSSTGRNQQQRTTPATPDLASLQLTSPRTTRSRTRSETNHSDVENDQSGAPGLQSKQKRKVRTPVPPTHKSLSLVKLRCQEINQKIEKSQKAEQQPAPVNRPILRRRRLQPLPQEPESLHNLRSSSAAKSDTPRTLRSQKAGPAIPTTPKPAATPRSALKRKSVVAAENTPPAKSPRTVNLKKPVVTRSRLATVLKLKKN